MQSAESAPDNTQALNTLLRDQTPTTNGISLPAYTQIPRGAPLAHSLAKYQAWPVFLGLAGRVLPGNFGFFNHVLRLKDFDIVGDVISLGLAALACYPSLEQMMDGAERALSNLMPSHHQFVRVYFPDVFQTVHATESTTRWASKKLAQFFAIVLPLGSGFTMAEMGEQGLRGMPWIGEGEEWKAKARLGLDIGTFETNTVNYIGQSLSLVQRWFETGKSQDQIEVGLALILAQYIYNEQFKTLKEAAEKKNHLGTRDTRTVKLS